MSTAIVTGGTKRDVDAMAVLAINIQEMTPRVADELIVFHDGISLIDQKAITSIMKTRFIRYKCPINWIRLISNKTIRYFSPMVFCKYECFNLLEEYDIVIWTDYDILIREDISELRALKDNMAFVINEDTSLKQMFYPSISKKDMQEYNLEAHSITMPLFVLKRELDNFKLLYDWCYRKTCELLPYLYLPEQCIVSLMMQEFNLQYEELSSQIYCMHPKDALACTKILHAYGQPKFWSGLHNEMWELYHNKWLNIREMTADKLSHK